MAVLTPARMLGGSAGRPCPASLPPQPRLPLVPAAAAVSQGVLAVVELLVRAGSHDYMVVANAISCVSHIMDSLQLSISNPHAAPTAPPKGRLAASAATRGGAQQQAPAGGPPPAKRACGAAAPAAVGGSPPLAMPHSSSSVRNNCAWGGSSGGNGGALGRSISMRQF